MTRRSQVQISSPLPGEPGPGPGLSCFLPQAVPDQPAGAELEGLVAVDVETADNGRDSACAVGLAQVEGGRVVRCESHLIRPPRRQFIHSRIHGITWSMVARQPTFAELWPTLAHVFAGARFLAAHNESFDRSVLLACCQSAGLRPPDLPFVCSLALSRRCWDLDSHALPVVCRHLGISLRHHDAASDAEACARIVLAAAAATPG